MAARPCDLGGRGVLVTRPAGQAAGLCRLIEDAGGRAIAFPTIEIRLVADSEPARRCFADAWDLIYFVSVNAVEQALALGADGRWPRARRLAAVGRGTARALTLAGRAPDLVPNERYESEALLALPELADMRGQRVLIVRGEGGRELFAATLRERGAEVRFAEVYRRERPEVDPGPLLARWSDEVAAVAVTSEEILRNLMALLGPAGQEPLRRTPLVVIAERTADAARALGFTQVHQAERAEDEAVVRALCALTLAHPAP